MSIAVTFSGRKVGPPGASGANEEERGCLAEPAGPETPGTSCLEPLAEVDRSPATIGENATAAPPTLPSPAAWGFLAAGAAVAAIAAARLRPVPKPLGVPSPPAAVGGRPVDDDALSLEPAPPPPTGATPRSVSTAPTSRLSPTLPPPPPTPRPPPLSPLPSAGSLEVATAPLRTPRGASLVDTAPAVPVDVATAAAVVGNAAAATACAAACPPRGPPSTTGVVASPAGRPCRGRLRVPCG